MLNVNHLERFQKRLDFARHSRQAGRPLSLYVNFPFCSSKCHYCYWVSSHSNEDVTKSQKKYADYVGAVIHQIDSFLKPLQKFEDFTIQDIYFGGGTPTVLPTESLVTILERIFANIHPLRPQGTVTIECSPDTVNYDQLSKLRAAGFDRISIGVQSFDDELLKRSGRAARTAQVAPAVLNARSAGFDNLNLDTMFGLPGESWESWENTFKSTLELGPDNISAYRFIPTADTVFGGLLEKKRLAVPDAMELVARYEVAYEEFRRHGYQEYIAGLFSKNNKRCTIDESYFRLKNQWIGFGAGANSFFGHGPWVTETKVERFIADPLASYDVMERWIFIFQALRTEGIDKNLFRERFGMPFEKLCQQSPASVRTLEPLLNAGHLQEDESRIYWSDRLKRTYWMCDVKPNGQTSVRSVRDDHHVTR